MSRNIKRILNLFDLIQDQSCFLFGPRQTGKTWAIKEQLAKRSNVKVYNLLLPSVFRTLSNDPEIIMQEITEKNPIIVIDEIQKLPQLLDVAHAAIEECDARFLLTGSSSRKLKRAGINLLGGRALTQTFHPFSYYELKDSFDLIKALNWGTLPPIYLSSSPRRLLESYVGTYLREEVAQEGLVRNIPSFSRFLEVAATCHGQLINFTQIASDAQVKRSTVQDYFQVLKDTFIGNPLLPYKSDLKRKAITSHKFYFFDNGVARFLQRAGTLQIKTINFGLYFESFIYQELKIYVDTYHLTYFNFWRDYQGNEVDFILNNKLLIEVKGKETIDKRDFKGLSMFSETFDGSWQKIVVSLVKRKRVLKSENISVYPWEQFIRDLWGNKFLTH